jgi:primosomal protein N''
LTSVKKIRTITHKVKKVKKRVKRALFHKGQNNVAQYLLSDIQKALQNIGASAKRQKAKRMAPSFFIF